MLVRHEEEAAFAAAGEAALTDELAVCRQPVRDGAGCDVDRAPCTCADVCAVATPWAASASEPYRTTASCSSRS